jgi:hypothetical protein
VQATPPGPWQPRPPPHQQRWLRQQKVSAARGARWGTWTGSWGKLLSKQLRTTVRCHSRNCSAPTAGTQGGKPQQRQSPSPYATRLHTPTPAQASRKANRVPTRRPTSLSEASPWATGFQQSPMRPATSSWRDRSDNLSHPKKQAQAHNPQKNSFEDPIHRTAKRNSPVIQSDKLPPYPSP